MPFTSIPDKEVIQDYSRTFLPTFGRATRARLADGWGAEYGQPGLRPLMPDAPPFDNGGSSVGSFFSYGGGASTTINTTNTTNIDVTTIDGGGGVGPQGPPGPPGPAGDPASISITAGGSAFPAVSSAPLIVGTTIAYPRNFLEIEVTDLGNGNFTIGLVSNASDTSNIDGVLC